MSKLVVALTNAGVIANNLPPSWGWSWLEILTEEQQPEWSVIGIEHAGKWQGIIFVDTHKCPCYHKPGAGAVYVSYMGTAPWNLGYYLNIVEEIPEFDEVGLILLTLAVKESLDCGFDGRVVMHAAQGSEGFFRKCGITELGPDVRHPNSLVRFEVTVEQARLLSGKLP